MFVASSVLFHQHTLDWKRSQRMEKSRFSSFNLFSTGSSFYVYREDLWTHTTLAH